MQRKYIKAFIAITAVIAVFLFDSPFYSKAQSENISGSDITVGLNIDTGVIAQRDNDNGQTTKDLQIEILTPESDQINRAIDQQKQALLNNTKDGLFLGKYSEDNDTTKIKDQLFAQQSSYFADQNISHSNQWLEIALAFVAAGVIVLVTYGCVMGFRRYRQQ